MKYNILIGGQAGQGMDTISDVLEKHLKSRGLFVFSNKDYMSRVRGGHNFIQIRFGDEPVYSHYPELDLIIALDKNTIEFHRDRLKASGSIIADELIAYQNERVISLPITKATKEIGFYKAFGMVAAGAALKYFNISLEGVEKVLPKKFSDEIKTKNLDAIKKGYELLESRLSLSEGCTSNNILINGNTAIALGALAGGLSFYSAYPMTPATSIMTYLSKKQVEAGIVVEQVEDEISAINMAIGASYAGARAMTGSSGGGFSLMVEALGLAGITETPLVVVNSQRPGPATGLPTRTEQSDLSFMLTASHGEFPRMVIALRNPEDAFYQTFRALNLADKYQTVVMILTDQYLADYRMTIPKFKLDGLKIERYISGEEVLEEGEEYRRYKLTGNGISPRLIPGKVEGQIVLVDSDEHTEYSHITESAEVRNAMMEKRMKKLELMKEDIIEPEYFGVEKPEVVLIGWGSTYGPLKEAVEMLNNEGYRVGALSFGDIYPLPQKLLRKYAEEAKVLVNVEQNYTGQLAKLIMQETGIKMDKSILKYDGRQIDPKEIYNRVISEVL
ncbi:2-oxoacid:acceptor oxidoreductase subunit alpha [Fonticella tunisiensis]|uniref:2-oxoglutarate ferredoxin oxidoreductase subunit alpha n=1 Tax=Fonticella tunisiensis TaxID=1096341 RepID=A0A4R7KTA9_9CLOT|nr:2-oxoacid:acceptor oxidoreductase subunit alpha [Fonticella tunisiensis]TDT61118.1 2-oxoglutarate ferredoxin oxidoreductase subunit alpha [Fonticella tunisiensis]